MALPAARAQIQTIPVDVKGEVVAVAPTLITIRTETGDVVAATVGDTWIEDGVQITGAGSTSYQVSGTETSAFLLPGMCVRFPARVERGRRVLGDVSQITVISQTPTSVFGLIPDDPDPAVVPGASAPEEGDGPKDEEGERFIVAGRLTQASRGAITVAYPGGTLRAKVARDAVVAIDASDLAYVRPGDAIHASGLAVKPPRFFANRVEVTRAADEKGRGDRGAALNGKNGDKGGMPERPNPFALGDPGDAEGDDAAAPQPAKVRGKILKVN